MQQQPQHQLQNQSNMLSRLLLGPTLMLCVLFAAPLHAVDYDVEIIIFEHVRDSNVGSSDTLLIPVISNSKDIPQVSTPGDSVQPLGELRLTEEVEKIKASDRHRLMYHGGWRQGEIDKESAPFMSIALGNNFNTLVENGTLTENGEPESTYLRAYNNPPLDQDLDLQQSSSFKLFGGIKVWVGRFLHLDTLLSYTPKDADFSFAFESERRMRSRQLHYIDHPRVGIITKIFPVDTTAPN